MGAGIVALWSARVGIFHDDVVVGIFCRRSGLGRRWDGHVGSTILLSRLYTFAAMAIGPT